ncbi:hypothetical protein [Solidesulfovibrio sp.]
MAVAIEVCRFLMRPEDIAEQTRMAALAKAGNHDAVRQALATADAACRARMVARRAEWTH